MRPRSQGALSRVAAIAGNTYREAVRMRLFAFLAVCGVASLGVGLYFQEFNLGSSELRFIADFGFGSMSILGSIMAIVATVQLVYGEFEHRTILPLLAKPVSRAEFLAGKLLGSWLTLCSFIAILTLSLVAALWLRELQMADRTAHASVTTDLVDYGQILLYALLQCLRLLILASFAAFFASYASSSLFAIFMSFLLWIVGQLHAVAADQLSQSEAWIPQAALGFITLAVPNLRLFDFGPEAIQGVAIASSHVLQLILYAGLYSCLYGAFALLSLLRREF